MILTDPLVRNEKSTRWTPGPVEAASAVRFWSRDPDRGLTNPESLAGP